MGEQFMVLPCEEATLNSSGWIASRPMSALLQDIKQNFWNWTVIFDLPPILMGDDVIRSCLALTASRLWLVPGSRRRKKSRNATNILIPQRSYESFSINLKIQSLRTIIIPTPDRPTARRHRKNTNNTQRREKTARAPRFKRMSQFFNRLGDANFRK